MNERDVPLTLQKRQTQADGSGYGCASTCADRVRVAAQLAAAVVRVRAASSSLVWVCEHALFSTRLARHSTHSLLLLPLLDLVFSWVCCKTPSLSFIRHSFNLLHIHYDYPTPNHPSAIILGFVAALHPAAYHAAAQPALCGFDDR